MDQSNYYATPQADLARAEQGNPRVITIARRQRTLLMAMLVAILISVAQVLVAFYAPQFLLLLAIPNLFVSVALLVLGVRFAALLYPLIVTILFAIFLLIPVLNLLVLLAINSRANKAIRQAGHRVGLLGVNIERMLMEREQLRRQHQDEPRISTLEI